MISVFCPRALSGHSVVSIHTQGKAEVLESWHSQKHKHLNFLSYQVGQLQAWSAPPSRSPWWNRASPSSPGTSSSLHLVLASFYLQLICLPWFPYQCFLDCVSHQLDKLMFQCQEKTSWRTHLKTRSSSEVGENRKKSCAKPWDGKEHEEFKGLKDGTLTRIENNEENVVGGISLMVQWLSLLLPNAGGPGSTCSQGTRSYMPQLRVRMPQVKILHVAKTIKGPLCSN